MAGHVISVQSEEAWVEADSVRIDQILINLVGNALKYTPAGGSIDIRVRPEDDDSVVEIVDTGVGMSPEALAHAFDLFFQADRAPERTQGGLGIGLSLARQLVELHGGSVQAASDGEGCGSRFTGRFPRSAPPVPDPVGVKGSRHANGPSRILLLEDDKAARRERE